MSVILNCHNWAKDMFGQCELGDYRLTQRLQKIAGQLSGVVGASLATSCDGDEAALEGSYRFIRNKRFTAKQIEAGIYKTITNKAKDSKILLNVEDTTTLNFPHSLREQLGNIGTSKENCNRGFIVHSSLLIDGETEETMGLINQRRWCRDDDTLGQSHKRKSRLYQDKESYKWEESARTVAERLGALMPKVISVCDREADIYEYIHYKNENKQRFIVRACYNRKIQQKCEHLFEAGLEGEVLGEYEVKIQQKHNRKARTARIELRSNEIELVVPQRPQRISLYSQRLTIVVAIEKEPPEDVEPLCWFLLTNEIANDFESARKITRYYELRWRIEEFHKAWKSGTKVELQRMQEVNNLEKMIVILACIAVRLLQLKESFEKENNIFSEEKISCSALLSNIEWHILWKATEKKKSIPKIAPSLGWAYQAIAKLGGWCNTKKTGKASWDTVWEGWFRLQERILGYQYAMELGKM